VYPGLLIENYHTVTCGQPLLRPWEAGDLWQDYFVPDAEPRISRESKADAPDCAGTVEGELYHRGNTRWKMTIERMVYFGDNVFPLSLPSGSGVLPIGTYASPAAMAQAWLAAHLNALPDANTSLVWNGTSFPRCVLSAEGRTHGPFVAMSYSAECSKASA
jgi:hypothetical protein